MKRIFLYIVVLISIPFLFLASTIDYNVIIRFSTLAYIIIIALLIGVLFTQPISGAKSWYKFGESFSFQPSELGKIVTILFLSFILNKLQLRGRSEINKLWKLFVFIFFSAVPVVLIFLEPDNGTMIAAAGYYAYLEGRRADLNLNSKSQDTLK